MPADIARQLGGNLRRARRQAGISQEETGFRASLHRTEIGLLERGARTPRIDTAVKLACALGVEPGLLLEGIGWTSDTFEPGGFTFSPVSEELSP